MWRGGSPPRPRTACLCSPSRHCANLARGSDVLRTFGGLAKDVAAVLTESTAPVTYRSLDVVERRLVAVESLGKPLDCTPQAILERHVMLPTEKPFGLAGIGDQPLYLTIGRARPGR
jgi:hypothetical protein